MTGKLRRTLKEWTRVPAPRFVGGNTVELLEGGDALFPSMCAAIDAAQHEVWLATYIFHDDDAAQTVARALIAAAARGVAVHVVTDGFGSIATIGRVRALFAGSAVRLEVFRALDRWWAWLQPGQLRRLHQKLCVCDQAVAFVGGINLIDDRHDMNHGWGETPRLDFAVRLQGPLVAAVHTTARAMWARAYFAHGWRQEVRALARSEQPMQRARELLRQLRMQPQQPDPPDATLPMSAAFLVRDNLRQRRIIERSYVEAIRRATTRVDIAVPYFYPGRGFRAALRKAARRGVQVRLLLQGKIDYRIAAMAAHALYEELRANGVRIYEYTPAFLHAKVALVDDNWATVGSSNIDPLSLLLNLEANIVVRDPGFAQQLAARFDAAFAASAEVRDAQRSGLRGWAKRVMVAAAANLYLRIAGITGRY
jgi:cardiolipin synthase A/B